MIENTKNKLLEIPRLTAAILGALYTLGFAPFSLWLVGLFSLSGLFWLFKNAESPKKALWLGVAFGVGHYVTSLHWLVSTFYITIGDWPLALAVGGLAVVLLSFYLSLYIGVIALAVQKFKSHALLPLLFASLWLLAEFVRSSLTPTFAWNLAGYQWAYADELLQVASLGGVYLLSFVFVLLAAVAVSCKKWRVAGCILFIGCYAFGYQRLASNEPIDVNTPAGDKIHIRLVSGNVGQIEKWLPHKKRAFIERYIRQSNDSVAIPDIVVWPETSITSLLDKHENLRRYLARNILAPTLIVGAPYKSDEGYYYNSLYALNADGDVKNRYDKRFLVPFGEYFPFREYFPAFFEKFLQGQGEYNMGAVKQSIIDIMGVKFSPLICGEIVLPNLKNYIHEDADYILNITNDAWFQGTIGPYQHFAFVKVRAVSLEKHFIRVGNYGINAFVDSFGRVLQRIESSDINVLNLHI